MIRLGFNVDHVATLRNARGEGHPSPVALAQAAAAAGADGITAHLREDRRHIRDEDLFELKEATPLPLNMEMAATDEMQAIALKLQPHACCLVPEKREEVTTEGGLEVAAQEQHLKEFIAPLRKAGARISFFIDPDEAQIAAAARCGADCVELHTGTFCKGLAEAEFARLLAGAKLCKQLGLELHAGHGLNYDSLKKVATLPHLREVNIGHFIIGEAITLGVAQVIKKIKELL